MKRIRIIPEPQNLNNGKLLLKKNLETKKKLKNFTQCFIDGSGLAKLVRYTCSKNFDANLEILITVLLCVLGGGGNLSYWGKFSPRLL